MISRRRFTTGVVIALTPLGSTASAQEYKAQQETKIARIGYLATDLTTDAPNREAFLQGLRDLGYIERQNVLIEYRDAKAKPERCPLSRRNWRRSRLTSS